jgi:hypothetical protein
MAERTWPDPPLVKQRRRHAFPTRIGRRRQDFINYLQIGFAIGELVYCITSRRQQLGDVFS